MLQPENREALREAIYRQRYREGKPGGARAKETGHKLLVEKRETKPNRCVDEIGIEDTADPYGLYTTSGSDVAYTPYLLTCRKAHIGRGSALKRTPSVCVSWVTRP